MTNRRFFTDLENPDRLELLETLFNPCEFLAHIMLDVIFHTLHNYFIYQKNMHICNSHSLYLLHISSIILRKHYAEYVNKVRLVKTCM